MATLTRGRAAPYTGGFRFAVSGRPNIAPEGTSQWFDGDPAHMERALHPDLVKRRAAEELGFRTAEEMVELT